MEKQRALTKKRRTCKADPGQNSGMFQQIFCYYRRADL